MNIEDEPNWNSYVMNDGDFLETWKVFSLLCGFWKLTDCEKRAMIRMSCIYFEGPGKFEEIFKEYEKKFGKSGN